MTKQSNLFTNCFQIPINGGDIEPTNFENRYSGVFQIFLDTLAKEVHAQKDKRYILILDNASWHKTKRLQWHHFQAYYLPPYSPDLNPIERLWQRLKADFFTDFITQSSLLLIERIIDGLRSFLSAPASVQSICALRR